MAKSSFALKRAIYENCPDVLKRAVGAVPFAMIAGPVYRRTMKANSEIDRADRNQLAEIERQHLGRTLRYAVDQVPYYRRFRSVVDRLPPTEALKAFPTIDKDIVQEHFEEFLSKEKDQLRFYETSTGGTSGNQLKLLLDNDSHYRETAFIHRLWQRVGFTTQSRKATFRGQVIEVSGGQFWRANPIYRELQFSTFHLSAENIDRYVDQLEEYRPDFIHGYPSAIAIVANHIVASGKGLTRPPRAVLLGSESINEGHRNAIEAGFGCRVFSWYGHSERLILGGECEQTSAYHQVPDYGFLEILNGDDAVAVGESGELVGTTYWNRIMPLIRYRTGDHARRLENECSCGRMHARFDSVQGRWGQEYLVGRSGAKVYSTALNMHGDAFARILRYQYLQDEVGKVTVRIMPAEGFSEADLEKIRHQHAVRLEHDFEIDFQTVEMIELTARGKLKRVVQNVPVE